MARPGITYQEVSVACDQITAASENPTINKVRTVLGTGSPNTILRHLNVWREAAPIKERKAPQLPADLQIAIIKEIERQIAESRAEIENELIQTKLESKELSTEGEALEAEIDNIKEQNQLLSDEVQQSKAISVERKEDIEKLEKELKQERDISESARLKLAQELNKVELLNNRFQEVAAENGVFKLDLTKSNERAIEAEREAVVANAKYEASQEKIFSTDAQLKNLAIELSNCQEKATLRERELEKRIAEQAEKMELKIRELESTNDKLKSELANAKSESSEFRGRLSEITKKKEKGAISMSVN
jgi:colicin import membrane protein